VPITVHALCPDAADTDMVRERAGDADAAIIFSAPRLLAAQEVAADAVSLLDSRQLVKVLPAWRGWVARATALLGRNALVSAGALRRQGERRRARAGLS
jgi:short-subunit dehydrogenase